MGGAIAVNLERSRGRSQRNLSYASHFDSTGLAPRCYIQNSAYNEFQTRKEVGIGVSGVAVTKRCREKLDEDYI